MFVNTSKKLQTLIQQHNKHGQIRSMASNKIAKCQLGKTMVKVMTFDTTKKYVFSFFFLIYYYVIKKFFSIKLIIELATNVKVFHLPT